VRKITISYFLTSTIRWTVIGPNIHIEVHADDEFRQTFYWMSAVEMNDSHAGSSLYLHSHFKIGLELVCFYRL